MKITAIRATPVNMPLEAPYLWALGEHKGFAKTIVEVETDEGITGLGEAPSATDARLIERAIAPRLVGHDPLDLAGAETLCLPETRTSVLTDDATLIRAFGAVEIALWDIRGKAWDQPLYRLLGGAVRRPIPFTDYFGYRVGREQSADAVAEYCQSLTDAHGTTMFEGKISFGDPTESIALVRTLRERLGAGAMIRLDSNMAYSLPTAIRIAREIEPLDIRNWEEPVATYDDMAQLRAHTSIRFSAHQADLARAVALGAPDAFVCNIASLGGIARTLRFVAACEAMGRDFWFYSGDAGVMSAAYLHLSAASVHIREPSQSLFRWQVWDVIAEGPFQPRQNTVPVPEGAGLGVTLDPQALARAAAHFKEHGALSYYRDPALGGAYRRLPIS